MSITREAARFGVAGVASSQVPASQEDVLRGAADKARRRREQQEAAADLDTRMKMNAAKNDRAREMRKQEVRVGRAQ